MDVPDTLNERFELFRSSGRFFKHNAQELFAEESWVQVLLGQGFEMKPDPVTKFVSDDDLAGFLGDLAEVIEDEAVGFARPRRIRPPPPAQQRSRNRRATAAPKCQLRACVTSGVKQSLTSGFRDPKATA